MSTETFLMTPNDPACGNTKKAPPVTIEPSADSSLSRNGQSHPVLENLGVIEPDSPKSAQDNIRLLRILPRELWLKIFDTIDVNKTHSEQNTLRDLYNASSFFRELLKPRQLDFFFPDVFLVLKKSNVGVSLGRECMKLRQICRRWKNAVDQYYQLHPLNVVLNVSQTNTNNYPDHYATIHLSSPPKLGDMIPLVSQPELLLEHYNPFPGRRIVIRFDAGDFLRQLCSQHAAAFLNEFMIIMLNNVNQLLQLCGNHIWYCKIELPEDSASAPIHHLYFYLTLWMESLQNLKTLEISYPRLSALHPGSLNLLNIMVGRHPMSALPQLEVLKMCNLPRPLFIELTRSNGHVEKIHSSGIQMQSG